MRASKKLKRKSLRSKVISAFDLDGTLVAGNTSLAFAQYLRRQGHFSFLTFATVLYYAAKHNLQFINVEEVHRQSFKKLFLGLRHDDVCSWAHDFVHKHLDAMLYAPAMDRLRAAQHAGHITAILSSGPDFLVHPIADKLGVERRLATHYSVDKDGRFCQIGNVVLGMHKAHYLQTICQEQGCMREDISAYSDSHYDIEFLTFAGNPVGVNPGTSLKSHCIDQGWTII